MTDAEMRDRDSKLLDWICPDDTIALPPSGICSCCGGSFIDEIQGPRYFEFSRYPRFGHLEIVGVGEAMTPPVVPQTA